MWWRSLQWKKCTTSSMPAAISISSQSDCTSPRPSVRNRHDSSNAVVANTTWPKPTPSVRKPPGTSGDENGDGAAVETLHDLDVAAPRRGHAGETRHPPRRSVVVRRLGHGEAGGGEPGDGGVERRRVDGLEADEHGVVRRTRAAR